MEIANKLRRQVWCGAVLLTMTPYAFAIDFIFSGGVYMPGTTAPEPLVAGQVLQINAGANKFFNGPSFTNQSGLVNWNADSLFMQNSAFIDNRSIWDAKSDNALLNNGGATSTFSNSGTFRKSGGQGSTSIGSIAFINSGIIDAQTGTISFGGGNASFNAGSQFVGAGATLITGNANFNGAFTSSNLSLTAGTFNGGAAVLTGTADFSGGFFQGNWTVAAGATLSGVNGGFKFLDTTTLTNQGTIAWQTGNSLFMQNGSSFINNALHDIQASSSIVYNGGASSTYANTSGATFRVAAGQTANIGSIAFVNNGTLTANGLLNFSGGNATFNNGTVFNGSGTSLITGNANFNGAFTSSNLSLTAGTFNGGAAVLTGTADFSGGLFEGNWTVAAGATLSGVNGGFKFLNTTTLTNQGTIAWQTGNSLFMQNGSSFINNALHDIQASSSIVYNGGASSTYANTSGATFRVAAGQTANIGSIAFVNNGTLTANGLLNFSGGNATFNNGTVFNGSGTSLITGNANFNGAFTSSNLSLTAGTFNGGAAVLTGTADFSGGLFEGNWTVAAGATLSGVNGGFKFLNTTTLTNQGTIAWQTGNSLFMQNGAALLNQGKIDLQTDSAMVFNGGAGVTFINSGLITKTGGAGTSTIGNNLGFDNQGVVEVRSGTIRLPDNFTNHGTLKGVGAFAATTLINSGHVAPGDPTGLLTLNGNYVQTLAGFLDIDLADNALFDAFFITGSANLDGTLSLSCIAACALNSGDEFVILDAVGDLIGTFDSVTALGFGDAFRFSVIYDYGADQVRLRVTGPDGPGSVPEPGTGTLLIAALSALAAFARRRQARPRRTAAY